MQFVAWAEPRQHHPHMLARDRHAPFGRPIIGMRQMQENRAAAALRARAVIIAQHRYEVIEAVAPPESLVARRIG